jgi:hypothetical protein
VALRRDGPKAADATKANDATAVDSTLR